MTLQDKIKGMLGIAKRGKYTCVGDDILFKIKKGKIRLIVISLECPKSLDETYEKLAVQYNCTTIRIMSKEELGNSIGLDSLNAIGISNSSIAHKIEDLQQEVEEYVKENKK